MFFFGVVLFSRVANTDIHGNLKQTRTNSALKNTKESKNKTIAWNYLFYQLLWNQNSAVFKKKQQQQQQPKKSPPGSNLGWKVALPRFQPTQPTIWPDPKPLWRSPPDPCGLAGDSFGWLVVFFFVSGKNGRQKIRKQSNKHVTNAKAIFVEKNEWIILVNYDIVHMFWFYWPPDISKHVQLIFGTMPFLL